MAVYRSDQAQVTFMTEAAPGGYMETHPQATPTSSGGVGVLTADTPAGTSALVVTTSSGAFEIGDTIQIEHGTTLAENEVREIEHISGTTFYLSAPTAFYHAEDVPVKQIVVLASQFQNDAYAYINLVPGAYETVDVPDPEMAIEGKWFLGAASKRDFLVAYGGQQTFAGSIGGFTILDGKSLRYPIGTVASDTTLICASAVRRVLTDDVKKGDLYVSLTNVGTALLVANVTKLVFDHGESNAEIRQTTMALASQTAGTILLDYPLQFDHAAASVVYAVATAAGGSTLAIDTTVVPYTHTISEAVELDSVTWNVHVLPSDGVRANAFDRRYFGGKIGNMTLAGEAGGLVTASWDSVNFLGMVHNQKTVNLSTVFGDPSTDTMQTPFFGNFQSILSSDVTDTFSTSEPYYFSQGEVQLFGQTIAKIISFSLSVNNNEEPKYYIQKQFGRRRGPTEIMEQRREYSLAVTLALPDAAAANVAQRTLFQEMLLEGNYSSSFPMRTGKQGFRISINFTRGEVVTGFEDNITINIPADTVPAAGANQQGAFIRTAPHNITEDNPFQVEADILFRNLGIVVQDAEHYYP